MFLKLDTFDGWLSQTRALALKPGLDKILRQSIRSSLSQTALILVSGDDLITYGIEFFKPTIINQTNPLYNSPSLLQPTKSPAKYSSHLCKYISWNIRHTSLEILSSFLRVCAYLTASIVPLLILSKNDNDGNTNCSSSLQYDWMNVYHNSNVYFTISAE